MDEVADEIANEFIQERDAHGGLFVNCNDALDAFRTLREHMDNFDMDLLLHHEYPPRLNVDFPEQIVERESMKASRAARVASSQANLASLTSISA